MNDDIAIKVQHVSKTFHEQAGARSVKEGFVSLGKKLTGKKEKRIGGGDFTALKDIDFEVKKGEFFGIVGRNGSGKSTLLKIIAGVYSPSKGKVTVNGKLTPFIELGVGFNPELSGRDNVYLNAALLGFTRKQTDDMYNDIVEFAELGDFMDTKLKNYSSGMQVRLAFSVAIRAESDVLLIDEVLAVGDAAFQRKCFDYFMLLKKQERTVILVTHDMGAVRQYCDRGISIEGGVVRATGKPELIAQDYQKLFTVIADKKDNHKSTIDRWGEGSVLLESAKIKTTQNDIILNCNYSVFKDVSNPILGFTIYGPSGVNILESNTKKIKYDTGSLRSGESISIEWKIPNVFASGNHTVSIACCDESASNFYDWVNNACQFDISRPEPTAGLVEPKINFRRIGVSND